MSFNSVTIDTALQSLHLHGYKAEAYANGSTGMYIVVQDPEHSVGRGASAGILVVTGYKPKTLTSYSQAISFIEARN